VQAAAHFSALCIRAIYLLLVFSPFLTLGVAALLVGAWCARARVRAKLRLPAPMGVQGLPGPAGAAGLALQLGLKGGAGGQAGAEQQQQQQEQQQQQGKGGAAPGGALLLAPLSPQQQWEQRKQEVLESALAVAAPKGPTEADDGSWLFRCEQHSRVLAWRLLLARLLVVPLRAAQPRAGMAAAAGGLQVGVLGGKGGLRC